LELHHVDLEKASKEIWDELSKLFGAKVVNTKISLKLQLFRFKMSNETTIYSLINSLKPLIRQLTEVGAKVEDEDAKSLMSSSFNNVVFTLNQIYLQALDDMI
jgi:hypothetical protein